MARIERVEAFFHTLPIDPSLVAGSGPQDSFEHIAVRITDGDGAVGYGECDAIPAAMAILESLARDRPANGWHHDKIAVEFGLRFGKAR